MAAYGINHIQKNILKYALESYLENKRNAINSHISPGTDQET